MSVHIIQHIARKTVINHLKNGWILVVSCLFFTMNLAIVYFSYSFSDNIAPNATALMLSLVHVQMCVIPLFALIISYDSLLKERELGTLNLLLTYPLETSDWVLGKWLGHALAFAMILVMAWIIPSISLYQLGIAPSTIVIGFGLSVLLGWVFISIGLFVSTLAKDRTLVIALAIVNWLLFVFLFDLGFVLLVVTTNGVVDPNSLNYALLLNPIDVFRVLNLLAATSAQTQQFYGVGHGPLAWFSTLMALLAWVIVPLGLTMRKRF